MKSKGGKIEYLCPTCQSPNIDQCKMYGQNSGWCNNPTCRTYWPWRMRLKVPINPKVKPTSEVKVTVQDISSRDISLTEFVGLVKPEIKMTNHLKRLLEADRVAVNTQFR